MDSVPKTTGGKGASKISVHHMPSDSTEKIVDTAEQKLKLETGNNPYLDKVTIEAKLGVTSHEVRHDKDGISNEKV